MVDHALAPTRRGRRHRPRASLAGSSWPVKSERAQSASRRSRLGTGQQTVAGGVGDGFGPVGGGGLLEDRAYVVRCGVGADEQAPSDLSVGASLGDEEEHIDL